MTLPPLFLLPILRGEAQQLTSRRSHRPRCFRTRFIAFSATSEDSEAGKGKCCGDPDIETVALVVQQVTPAKSGEDNEIVELRKKHWPGNAHDGKPSDEVYYGNRGGVKNGKIAVERGSGKH